MDYRLMLEQLLKVQIEECLHKAQQLTELLHLVQASQPAPVEENLPPIDLSFID
jgi:hypothetical protein